MISLKLKPVLNWRLACLFVMLSTSLQSLAVVPSDGKGAAQKPDQSNPPQSLPLEELRAFSEVYYYVKSTYVEEVDDKLLINAAIKGMVSSLDSHSRYLDPIAFASFTADNDGEYAGLGLSFNDHPKGIQIETIVAGSPADRHQLRRGMVVTAINDINIKQISSEDAYKLLHGKINSQVKLTVIVSATEEVKTAAKKGVAKNNAKSINKSNAKHERLKDFFLTREIIILPSIISQLLPNGVGYLAIEQFTKKTPAEFVAAIEAMSSLHPLNELIIDLRNNLGGALESSIEVSDLFIDSGILLTSSGRASDANEVYRASAYAPYSDMKVVVMMNAYTASSSEILAAALSDHNKATLLGNISYGKGSIQTIYLLRKESGLKLTTAKYFSPNGNKIQDVGIEPDVLFKTAGLENDRKEKLLDDLEVLQAFNLVQAKKRSN